MKLATRRVVLLTFPPGSLRNEDRLLENRAMSPRVYSGMLASLEMTPADDEQLQWFIRTNLDAWQRYIHPLKAMFPVDHSISTVAFSPDGQTILTGSVDGTAQLWNAASGQRIGKPMLHQQPVIFAVFSGRNNRVATSCLGRASATQTVRVWDAGTGEPVGPNLDHEFSIASPSFSPDSSTILTRSFKAGTVRCWNVETGKILFELGKQFGEPRVAAFHPDGKTVVTGSKDGAIRLCRADTGQLVKETDLSNGEVQDVVFSPDGLRILVGSLSSLNGVGRLLDADSLEPIGEPMQHENKVFQVGISPDSRVAFTLGIGKVVRLWDAKTGRKRPISELVHDALVQSVAFSGDSTMILTRCSDDAAFIWDIVSGERVGSVLHHRNRMVDVDFGPDGRTFLTAGEDSSARLWSTNGGNERHFHYLPSPEIADAVAFSTDGAMALTAGQSGVQRWNIAARERIGDPLRHERGIAPSCAVFSPDDKTIWAGMSNGDMRLWDKDSGKLLNGDDKNRKQIKGIFQHDAKIFEVLFSPDGQRILTVCIDRSARLWNKDSLQTPERILDHGVSGAAFSPDGEMLATSDFSGMVRVWKTSTGEQVGTPLEHPNAVWGVSFSPDGKTLLTTSISRAYLWNWSTSQSVLLPHGDGGVLVHAFSPDGQLAMTGGADKTMRLWDSLNAKPIGPPLRHRSLVIAGAFSPDGRTILTGCMDQKTRLWDVPQPVRGETKRIVLWIEVLTGSELDDVGKVHTLDAATWEARRQELQDLGGPPIPYAATAARADDADFPNPSGTWTGWFKNNAGMPEIKSTINIRWDGVSGSGNWDADLIHNMNRLIKPDGSLRNRYEWTHQQKNRFYKVSIVPFRTKDDRVVTLFATYEVTDNDGKYLYDGQGYFDLKEGR